ncbi:MAG TPA: TonB-dependent receptor [Steroidobacteraceae bacterium]|nr:TonB-dependent receptor [Steroidobacteraceae bacterium]
MNKPIGRGLTASSEFVIRLLAAGAGIAAALAAPLVSLAETVAANSTGLEEIVVTANKLNAQKVLDIPVSIQAISGESLQNQSAAGIMSIAGQVPGLSIQDLGPGDKKYVIRGINSTGDATTGVYYGEAVISGSNADDGGGFESDIRLFDLNRVEVLRGPQGTLYGASSMSGTIRFVPNSPDLATLGGYVTMEGSQTSHAGGNYNINGEVNLPIIDGVLALRLVGWKLYDSGYINQTRVGEGVTGITNIGTATAPNFQTVPVAGIGFVKGVNDDDVGGGRAIVRFHPNENLTIDANYTTQTETSGGSSRYTPAGVAAFAGGPIPPIQGCDLCNTDVTLSPWSDNTKIFGLTVEYKTGFGTITGTTNQYNRTTGFTFDSTPVLVSFDVPVPAETLEPRTRKLNSSEVRFASDLNSPLNFVAGVFREHETQDLAVQVIATGGDGLVTGPFSTSTAQDALDFPGVGNTFFGRTDQRSDTQYAGFGEATWKITDAWTAVAGVRYFTETLNGVQTQTHPFGGFPGAPNLVPVPDPEETFNKVTWKVNTSYKFSEAVLAYGTISTGFRSGGLNAVSEPFEPIPAAYSPDSLTNYELGAKGRLFGGLFDYQADVYFIKWNNIQVQETTADAAFVYQGNAGTANVKGFEFEFTAHPIDYLSATFAGSYQQAYLTQGATPDQYALNKTLGRTGDGIPNVPRFQANFGLNYTRPIMNGWEGVVATDLTFRGRENSYFSSAVLSVGPPPVYENVPLSSYTLVNLRLGVINGPWSVTAFARNLTNKRAEISAINSSQDPDALLTVRPRTIGLTATRKF